MLSDQTLFYSCFSTENVASKTHTEQSSLQQLDATNNLAGGRGLISAAHSNMLMTSRVFVCWRNEIVFVECGVCS